MILEVIDNRKEDDRLNNENDSLAIQKIKEMLSVYNLEYMSDILINLLNYKDFKNSTGCFKKKKEYRVITDTSTFRVLLYIRLSVQDGDIEEGNVSRSIINQLLALLDESQKKNWDIVAIFCEDGISGSDNNRPEWNKSLKYCEMGNVDIYVAKTQSRFARSVEMVSKYLHREFKEWNVRFVSLFDRIDTSIRENKMLGQVYAIYDEHKLENQSIETRKTLRKEKENGLYAQAYAYYGYKKDPKDKYHLLIDESTAPIVKRIFKLYAEGYSLYKIALTFSAEKIPTPAEYYSAVLPKWHVPNAKINKIIKYQLGVDETIDDVAQRYNATISEILELNQVEISQLTAGSIFLLPVHPFWCPASIKKILTNPAYIGTYVAGRKTTISYNNHKKIPVPKNEWINVPHCWNAIIDKETWLNVQDKLTCGRKARPMKNGKVSTFNGLVFCEVCGRHLWVNTHKRKKKNTTYLRCGSNSKTTRAFCDNSKQIRLDYLEKYICDELNKIIDKFFDEDLIQSKYLDKKINSDINKQAECLKKEIAQLETKISSNDNKLALLYDDRANGVITLEEFKYLKSVNIINLNNLKNNKQKLMEELDNLKYNKKKKVNLYKNLFKYKHIETLTRDIVDEFIDKIVIGRFNEETKDRPIHIKWKL